MYITEGKPYRPDIILWMELPAGCIVGSDLVHPVKPEVSLGESLLAAIRRPMVGSPRRPDRIRVANAALASEVRAVVGAEVSITIAPTPELDSVVQTMADHIGEEGAEPHSYFEAGRVSRSAVEELFRGAELLFRGAPWKVMHDQQLVRVDIPRLGIEGACLSIIGALGESLGMILFPSLAGYVAFTRAALSPREDGPIDLGTTCLSLNFERGTDLPATMRREIAEHAWPVAGPEAYPQVILRDHDGLPCPLSETDVRVISACAISFAAFFATHRSLFESDSAVPVCESYSDETDLTVRFTVPYEASSLFEIEESLPHADVSTAPVGRNSPCPCGSGKKYKKCHLGADESAQRSRARVETVHERDNRLLAAIYEWASPRFGMGWAGAIRDAADENVAAQLVMSWCAYHATAAGRRIVDRFVEGRKGRLSSDDRAWLLSQQSAWLSVWEVSDCESGVRVRLEDLLSGETRDVCEVGGSQTLVKRDTLLARVVDHGGMSFFCGTHPRPLPPWDAAEVVRRVRARLHLKRGAVPVDQSWHAVGDRPPPLASTSSCSGQSARRADRSEAHQHGWRRSPSDN